MNNLLLICGGGHCLSVLDSLANLNYFNDIAIIDRKENLGKTILEYNVIGCDDDLPALFDAGFKNAFVALGSIGDPSTRIKIYTNLKKIGFKIPIIIDPSAIVSKNATISEGVFIGKGAIVNAGTKVGCCAIINSGAIMDHECTIGEFCHIAPGCTLSGNVTVGNNTHIGTGASIINNITIGKNTIIGGGSVVIKNINNGVTAYGVPACEV